VPLFACGEAAPDADAVGDDREVNAKLGIGLATVWRVDSMALSEALNF